MLSTIERSRVSVVDNAILTNTPLNAVGAAFFIQNSGQATRVLTIDESDDGINYAAVLFALPTTDYTQTSLELVGQAVAVVLVRSAKKFVRISLDATAQDPVFVDVMQFTK